MARRDAAAITDKPRKARKRPTRLKPRPIDWSGMTVRRQRFPAGATIYAQGDSATSVYYLERGRVQVAVVSRAGKEAVIAVLDDGQFFGEGCLGGQQCRMAATTTISASTIVTIAKEEMVRRLHERPEFAALVLRHILERTIRVEEDLIDQLFNSSEKRLARALVLLAHYGQGETPQRKAPMVTQNVLAEMIGTTRSRVNFFMNKFRRFGFIEYNGQLKVNDSLLTVVLRE
ncbi:MAG TPA: Crp/Fnr family transcriptional regulator [Vicinamibacterales bacterium]|nr:Crp/Fnr family transcriptional regulator [Vicinamibacterales bacterium]